MDAKKLTMAVSFLMVLAAAFVLVVPSESDDAAAFEITDAHFQQGTTGVYVYVTFSETVSGGKMTLYLGDEVIKKVKAIPAGTSISTKAATTLEDGTYTVVAETEKGTVSKDIVWPTPVQNEIKINKTVGGTITADKSVAFPGEEVKLTVVADDNYRLVGLDMNGDEVDLETLTFIMPNKKASVTGEFEQIIVNYKVTFMVSSMKYDEQEVLKGTTVTAPAEPTVKGVEFAGWCTADDEPFDLSTPITQDTVLYASYAAESPSTEQTTKFVASLVKDEDTYKLVTTAYDEKIIGEGTATVTVLQKVDFGGYDVYIKAGEFTVDFKADATFLIKDITADISEYISSGSYAAMAEVTLDNGTTYKSSYIAFDVNGMA